MFYTLEPRISTAVSTPWSTPPPGTPGGGSTISFGYLAQQRATERDANPQSRERPGCVRFRVDELRLRAHHYGTVVLGGLTPRDPVPVTQSLPLNVPLHHGRGWRWRSSRAKFIQGRKRRAHCSRRRRGKTSRGDKTSRWTAREAKDLFHGALGVGRLQPGAEV